MVKLTRTLAIGTLLTLALCVLPVQRLLAIGPTVLMFYGEPLKKAVFVTGADAALFPDRTVLQPSTVNPEDLVGRTYLSVGLFWGPPEDPARNGVPLAQLTPLMAWQHARFYPATATQPALLLTAQFQKQVQNALPDARTVFNTGGPVGAPALAALQRLGIPTGPPRPPR